MTCQRVIIINRGRLVAVDTPENLTTKLQTSSRLLVRVEGPATEVVRALGVVSGVQTVKEDGGGPGQVVTCIIESKKDRDVRKDVAAAVVHQNWGLLELAAGGLDVGGRICAPRHRGEGEHGMSSFWPIFKRELRAYFVSPIAYVVMVMFLTIAGYFFYSSFAFLISSGSKP